MKGQRKTHPLANIKSKTRRRCRLSTLTRPLATFSFLFSSPLQFNSSLWPWVRSNDCLSAHAFCLVSSSFGLLGVAMAPFPFACLLACLLACLPVCR